MKNKDDHEALTPEEIREMMAEAYESEVAAHCDTELLCGTTLLAEAYEKSSDYAEVCRAAEFAIELLDDGNADPAMALDALERIAEAVKGTPYNHLLRDLLRRLILMAAREPEVLKEYKSEAEYLLKLDILLEPDPFDRPDKKLTEILSGMFTSKELVGIIANPSVGFLRRDPVEYTWKWEAIAGEVERKLDEMFKGERRHMGFCFRYWSAKEKLLKNYGIEWRSPGAMNPGVHFD